MKKIYINPGHSDKDPGAVGYETERKLNVAVSDNMNAYLLENYVCETRMNPGTMDNLNTICADANNWGADLFVSIHFNAGGGDGWECFVYAESRRALGSVFEKYIKAAGQNSRGVKVRPGLVVLSKTHMPAIVNEGAFVDNLSDIRDWNEEGELKKLGEAYAKAAAEFLGLEKRPVAETKPATGYTYERFVRELQAAIGATVDGKAGPETLSKTPTLSRWWNRKHKAVKPVQKRLFALGYQEVGEADGVAGAKFAKAVKAFQKDNGCAKDGELTAKKKTWRKLLGLE